MALPRLLANLLLLSIEAALRRGDLPFFPPSGFSIHHELFPVPSFWMRIKRLCSERLCLMEFWKGRKVNHLNVTGTSIRLVIHPSTYFLCSALGVQQMLAVFYAIKTKLSFSLGKKKTWNDQLQSKQVVILLGWVSLQGRLFCKLFIHWWEMEGKQFSQQQNWKHIALCRLEIWTQKAMRRRLLQCHQCYLKLLVGSQRFAIMWGFVLRASKVFK